MGFVVDEKYRATVNKTIRQNTNHPIAQQNDTAMSKITSI